MVLTALIAENAQTTLTFLHKEPIPFPLANWQAAFAAHVRTALAKGGVQTPL